MVELPDTYPTQMLTYWGNPETGEGVPAGQVWGTVRAFLSEADDMAANLFDIGEALHDIKDITLNGVGDELQGEGSAENPGAGDTNGDGSQIIDKEGDYTGNYEITVTLSDGTINTAIVELTQEQFEYLNGLLFDSNGNSRLFEKEVAYTMTVQDAEGNDVEVPSVVEGETIVTNHPIILTPTQNNGGTEEIGKTSAADDFIVAGRLDLLHGAYIDGGEGNNTLEIDAKGYYAQPKELLNIQTINIENLPNVYTNDSGDSTYPDLSGDGSNDSTIDLSRAVDLEKLTITESDFDGVDEATLGTLTIAGVRNGALTRFEGEFSQDVTVHYGEGLTGELNIELAIGDVDGTINLLHNASTLNIDSQGTENHMHTFFAGGTLSHLNISGEAIFSVEDSMDSGFNSDRPAVIDASANTGGVDLTINNHEDEVIFTGTAEADDQFQANNNGKAVTINAGNGDNELTAENGEVVTITAGDGANTIRVDGSDTVSVTAGNGGNMVSAANVDDVTISTGEGADVITASAGEITINSQGGDDVVTVAGREGSEASGVTASPNLVLVLDDSGSMSNGQTPAPIEAQAAAVAELFDQLPDDTAVYLVADLGSGTQPADAWVTKAQALAVVNTMQAQGYWNTAGFITEVQAAFGDQTGTYNVGGANEVVFITDGGNSVPDEQAWIDFLVANDVRANVLGIGANDQSDIDVINSMAYDGRANADLDGIVAPTTAELSGLLEDLGRDIAVLNGNGAKVNIDLGEGNNVLVLGNADGLAQGLVAYEGSSITGENITMVVNADSDLRAATLNGITSVVLDNGDVGSADRTVDNAKLTLTSEQFLAIGAENFSVEGSIFHTYAQIEIIVTDDISLTDLGVDNLSRNIDLILEVQDGVTLEMTAEQLHTRVAEQGVTLANDNNGDQQSGSVLITNAGLDFDPFNSSDDARSIVDGVALSGGSLSSDFGEDGNDSNTTVDRNEWGQNVLIDRNMNGYDRPADVPSYSRLVINTDEMSEIGPFETIETFLRITGDSDLTFTPVEGGVDDWGRPIEGGSAIALGVDNGVATNGFIVDFSSVGGDVINLTLANFENADAIYGNGSETKDVRVNVEINEEESLDKDVGEVGSLAQGLVSSGVQTYVVTDIDLLDSGSDYAVDFYTCETTQDLEVLGLQGNYGKTINFLNTERGVEFLMEVAYDKQDGYAVGELTASFARPEGATAVVNVVGLDTLPAGEVQLVDGISTNATAAVINIEGGNTVIEELTDTSEDGNLTSLTVTADADLAIETDLPATLESFDASGVVGELAVTVDLWQAGETPLTFEGAAGSTTLTIDDAAEGAIASITGAGEVSLVIGDGEGTDSADLSDTSLTNVTSVSIHEGQSLTLTMEQADTIGAENFSVIDTDGNGTITSTSLTLEGLNDQPFSLADYPEDVEVTLTLAEEPVVTLHPDTDLTGIAALEIPEGTVLELTAEQFQQLEGNSDGNVLTGSGSVHITDMSNSEAIGEHGEELDLSTIAIEDTATDGSTDGVATVTISLADTVNLSAATVLDANGNPVADTFNIGDGLTLVLEGIEDADGVEFVGGAESTLKFIDIANDAEDGSIDASKFGTTYVQLLNVLVADANVDLLLDGLPGSVTKVIYNGDGWVTTLDQVANVEPETTVDGLVAFDTTNPDVEIANFTLNLQGAADITGNLDLTTGAKFSDADGDRTQDTGEANLMRAFLQSLTINSTDETENSDATNLLTGETANIIGGKVTATDGADSARSNNNLLNVTITGDQALVIEGGIEFSSVVGDDDFTANDNDEAVATLNVESDASVVLGVLDTSDVDVVELVVNQTGAGDLTFTLDPDNLVADDQLTINGSATAQTTIVVADGATDLDLSDDTLVNVDAIVLEDDADLVLTQAQFNDIGAANFSLADNASDADIDLVAFEGAVVFDATALETGIDIDTITMAPGAQVMDPATNLMGVAQIVVPEGGSLTLTADQFAQLDGAGSIVGVGATQDFTVTITGLDQADVDAGLDLTGIDSTNIIVDVDGSVNLHDTTELGTVGNLTFQMDDNAILGLAEIEQLSPTYVVDTTNTANQPATSVVVGSGLTVIGGTGSSVELQFTQTAGTAVNWWEAFDASGIQTDTIRLLNDLVMNRNIELLQGIDSDVEVIIFETLEDFPGYLATINRVVEVEPGVTIDGFIVFNDSTDDSEIRTLQLDLQGDATVDGSIYLTTRDKDSDKLPRNFDTLTINSLGTDSNTIDGNITPISQLSWTNDNSLLNVNVNADQALEITGDIVFNSLGTDGNDDTATLNITGTADVTIEQLDVTDNTDDGIGTLVVNNAGTGVLTITGSSPAILTDETGQTTSSVLETLIFEGQGDIVLGTDGEGISSEALSEIDASGLSGNLTLEVVDNIDSQNFSFTAGTGVTTLTLTDADLSANVNANPADTGWSFDFTNAQTGTEFHLAAALDSNPAGDFGPLNINMGPNGVLFIDATMDLSGLDLTILGDQPIVLADDVTLTLTAAQASGLNIVAGTDVGNDGYNGSIEIIDLGDYADLNQNGSNDDAAELIDYDFSGLQVPASATLADNDVTLSVNTDLGDVVINLVDLADGAGGNAALTGQTIRFATEEQAARTINVGTIDGEESTNVIWLFDSVSGPVDTSGYDPEIARLWILEALANGTNIEQLFTSLPSTIVRVDFADLDDLPTALDDSTARSRVVELASFTNLPAGLSFSDEDRLEHVETLTIRMGGEVTLGNVEIDNIIDLTVNQANINFTSLVIDSLLADNTNDLLAADGYDENTNVAPVAANVIGDISVGTEEGLELLSVTLNTGDNLGMDGNDLEIGTIYFEANATNSATLIVTGDNDVTIKSLDTSDPEVDNTVTVNAAGHTGNLVVTGGSPAAAVADIEALFINGTEEDAGTVYFGHVEETENVFVLNLDGNGVPYAGVAGAELSLIEVDSENKVVNLGVLALIDGTDDDSDDDGIADVDAFTLTGNGNTSAILGEGNVDGVVTSPLLEAGSTWAFNSVDLTIQETTNPMFEAGAILEVDGGSLTIEGEVNLTEVTLTLTNGAQVFVPADQTLILTVEQVKALDTAGVDVTGSGTVEVIGNGDDATASIFSHLRTANVDLSAVVLTEDDADDVFAARFVGGESDAHEAIGQTITGSAFDDYIIAGEDTDDTLIGGAGNDTLVGGTGSGSSDTYNVDAGTDTITDLHADGSSGEEDVLVVSSGAEAVATGITTFTATAETINNGTATLTGASGDSTIDVSLAGGDSGFILIGGPDDGSNGANTLTGSANDDIINGGDDIQNGVDVLTGGLGDDRFVFNVSSSVPASFTEDDQLPLPVDQETIEYTPGNTEVDSGDEEITITYALNGLVQTAVTVTEFDAADAASVHSAIAAALDARPGISAYVTAGRVVIEGDNGNSVGNVTPTLSSGTWDADGTPADTAITSINGTDIPQVTRLDIDTSINGVSAGEEYTVTVTLAEGGGAFGTAVAGSNDPQALAEALADSFNTNAGPSTVVAVADNTSGSWGITFTDENADNGGFSLSTDAQGTYGGSGASNIGATDLATADIITDFTLGENVIDLGLVAGSSANYAEAAEAGSYAVALSDAASAFDGTVQYYLTSIEATGAENDALSDNTEAGDSIGLLFFDANADGAVDGVIAMVGVDESNFAYTDIVA
ncbi:hypothetical protein CFI10_17000 [Marinobacterium iners]|nr:hypothetical protein CFI10_17000 [Marinobacterium iners]